MRFTPHINRWRVVHHPHLYSAGTIGDVETRQHGFALHFLEAQFTEPNLRISQGYRCLSVGAEAVSGPGLPGSTVGDVLGVDSVHGNAIGAGEGVGGDVDHAVFAALEAA
ncbi:hypothetical protein MKOR_33430 [Mycolicibacillus koreensis]|nr:hypothetical protein MKOR_33430 [Mycolicibacillus koreensis]